MDGLFSFNDYSHEGRIAAWKAICDGDDPTPYYSQPVQIFTAADREWLRCMMSYENAPQGLFSTQ